MKATALFGVAGAGALMIAGAASAQYQGLVVENVTNDETAALGLQTWTVSVAFGSSDNVLHNIFEAGEYEWVGEVGFHHGTIAGIPGTAQALPFGEGSYPSVEEPYDSFVTIGQPNGADPDQLDMLGTDPSFSSSAFLNDGNFGNNGGWFSSLPKPGEPLDVNGLAGDDQQVLIAQLTIAEGSAFSANINGTWVESMGDGGGQFFNETFLIPAPGALALLGMAGLVGTRRRRA